MRRVGLCGPYNQNVANPRRDGFRHMGAPLI
jgi:hypothetical protein